ncbi:hypothetical protein TPR58_12135 [Sphingomonas sp. HF-S3]|uniref:Uncharacterized protein n=1 Tax=Sphingomonas rustica TaxID=3103142 RepID=A0ABV0B8M4_9SPHN
MRLLYGVAAIAALTFATAAHAQGTPPSAAPPAGGGGGAPEFRGPDERLMDLNRMSDDVNRRSPGKTSSSRPVPARPEDVIQGSEVRDSRGAVIASVEKVGNGFAVLSSPGGKIEVEFASLAVNNKGLLINMPKAKFDAILSGGKPK